MQRSIVLQVALFNFVEVYSLYHKDVFTFTLSRGSSLTKLNGNNVAVFPFLMKKQISVFQEKKSVLEELL